MNIENYFASRIAEANSQETFDNVDTRYDQLQEASKRAVARAEQASARRKKEMERATGSWAGQLGFDPVNDLGGIAINSAAGVANAGANLAGSIATIPSALAFKANTANIPDNVRAAYARKQNGSATAEDEALLSLPSGWDAPKKYLNPLQRELINSGQYETNAQRIESALASLGTAKKINEFTDVSSIYDPRASEQTQEKAQQESQGIADTFTSAKDNFDKSNYLAALADAITGAGKAVKSIPATAIENPMGTLDMVLQQAPQLGLAIAGGPVGAGLTGAGIASDTFLEAVAARNKKEGVPLINSSAENEAALWAAAAGATDAASDLFMAGGAKLLKAGAQGAGKRTLADRAKGIAEGAAGEVAAEGLQEIATQKANADELDLVKAGAFAILGGVVGGAIRGGFETAGVAASGAQAASEAAATVRNRADNLQEEVDKKDATYKEAMESGNPGKYADPYAKEYNPEIAVDVLYKSAQKANDQQTIEASKEKASEVLATASERVDKLTARIEAAKNPEQAKEKIEASITQLEEEVKNASPDDVELAQLNLAVAKDKLDEIDDDIKRIPALEKQLDKLNTSYERANRIFNAFSTPSEVDTTDTDNVINLSMSAPAQVKDTDLQAIVSSDSATPAQKAFAESSLASREAIKKAESVAEVNTDILYGNQQRGMVGLQQYRKRIGTALMGNKPELAKQQLDNLKKFAESHQSKAALARLIYDEAVASGTNNRVTIAPNSKGQWEVREPSEAQRKANTFMTIHRGSNKSGLIDAVMYEADALTAGVAEMEAAISSKSAPTVSVQSPNRTQPSAQAKPDASVTPSTAPVPAQQSQQKTTTYVQPTQEVVAKSPTSLEKMAIGGDDGVANQAQVATPDSSKESTQTENQSQTVKETEGGLSVFAKVVDKVGKLGEDFKKLNLVAQFFQQRSSKSNDVSTQPLVEVKNFISAINSGEATINDFLSFEPTSEQVAAINHFISFYKKVASSIPKNIGRQANEYSYQDMIEFFKEGEDIEQNVKIAIALAAYSWIAENGNQPNYNDDETIRDMLGMGDFDTVTQDLRNALIDVGTNERNIIASMGQKAVASLGLKMRKNAPQNLKANLETSIGAQAWKILDSLGYLERTTVPGATIKAAMPAKKQANYDASVDFNFSRVKRENREVIAPVKSIIEAQKGTSSVLSKLFGFESDLIAPSLTPIKEVQKTTKNTNQPVPSALQKILKHENSVPNLLRQDTWGIITALDIEAVRDIAGYDRTPESELHISQRKGIEAKNNSIDSQIANSFDFFGSIDPDAPMYFKHTAWKQQRVGIDTNLINPQTSKFQRFLVYRPEWETTVDLNNQEMVDSLTLRIGEGLGVKTDKQSNASSLEKITGELVSPVYQAAAQAIQATMIEGGEMTPELQKAIVEGVKQGGENMHSLDSLIALAQWNHAKETGKSEVTVRLMGEIDGVTNGPMLSHLLMGAAPTPESLYGMLNRGGFFSVNQEDENYNVWRGKAGNQDLYETTIAHVLERMSVSEKERAAFYAVVGKLDDGSGKIEKAGRNIIKTPLTAMVFGSSLDGAIDSMFDKFVDTVYTKMVESANQPETKATNLGAINTLLRMGGSNELFTPKTDLLETNLTTRQVAALRQAFDQIIGNPVKETMDTDFAVFMASRKTVNDAAQAAYKLYDAARKGITEKFIADKMESGEIAYRKTRTGKEPIHDLTPALKEELGALLLPVTPIQATLFSLESKQPDAGLEVAKTARRFSRNPAYQGEAHFGTPTSTGTKSLKLAAYEFSTASPGVAMMVMSVHSTDSAISHNAVMGFGTPTQVLNVHDAHGSGLQYFARTAQNLNRATWDAMLKYSPASEMNNTLHRTIQGMAGLLNTEYASAITPYLKDALSLGTTKKPVSLDSLVSDMALTAASADRVKFRTMEQMSVVDQYALEGGEYQVTDADRAEAKKLADEAKANLPKEVTDAVSKLNEAASGDKTVDSDAEYQQETQPTPAKSLAAVMSPAVIATVATNTVVKSKLDQGQNIQEASKDMDALDVAKDVQSIAEAYSKVKTAFSPWGAIGTSAITHDANLVAAFEANPVMNKEQFLSALRPAIDAENVPANVKQFHVAIFAMLKKSLPENLKVTYVTPTTSSNGVMGKGAERSRGWYMSKAGSNEIYVLSTEHKYAGITAELLMHEAIHSVLAGLIEQELAAKAKNANYKSETLDLINSLDSLREKAKTYMSKQNINDLSPAVTNVHEFVSWGMTNLDFQKNVLSKISAKAAPNSNSLISGTKDFFKKIIAILFRKSDKSKQAIMVNGLTLMVANTTGLFKAATNQKSAADILLNQEATDPMSVVSKMTSEELYSAIQDNNPNNRPSAKFENQLLDVLTNLVSKIHEPMRELKEVAEANKALSALDVFSKALDEGKLPFAAKSIASGFKINNQEAFVMEQVEATVRAALDNRDSSTTAAYSELRRVYMEARSKIKPMDLLPEGVTEATATQVQKDEAQALWNAAFNVVGGSTQLNNYMSQFVALALANEAFASKLGFDVKRQKREANTLFDRVASVMDALVNFIFGKLTKTTGLSSADEFIKQLASNLVDIEYKRRTAVPNTASNILDGIEKNLSKVGKAGQEKLDSFANSDFFKKAKNGYVRAGGLAISVVSAPERVLGILDGISELRDKSLKERQDVLSSMISEMRGLTGAKDVFLKLLMQTKNIERERASLTANVAKAVLESFEKKNFSRKEQRAMTAAILRTDLASLVDGYSMNDIQRLMRDKNFLNAEITKLENSLRTTKYANEILNQADALGYFMATGVSRHPKLMLNAHNIIRLAGSENIGKVSEKYAMANESTVDMLVSLFAIKYTSPADLSIANTIFASEMKRAKGNGVEAMIKLHKALQKDSKERLFENNEALVIKGYLPEVTNPYITFKVADEEGGKLLMKQGYTKGDVVGSDPTDTVQGEKHIYVLRDGGQQRYLSAMISFTGNQSKGTSNQADNSYGVAKLDAAKNGAVKRINNTRIDPTKVSDMYMIPVLNNTGAVVNYRYMASNGMRDSLLERDNRFDHLLGTMAGNTYDKTESPAQNKLVITALKEQYDLEKKENASRFFRIAPDSDNPEFREIWNMLPYQTKQDIESIWGAKELYVRNDLMDITFGYRKFSLANLWDKEDRNKIEELFVDMVDKLLEAYAAYKGEDAEVIKARAKMYIRRGEDIWTAVVAETKDIIVVRTGTVLWGNIMSNMSILSLYGVPVRDIIRHHRVALKAATDYQKDKYALDKVNAMLEADYLEGNSRSELENQKAILEDAIARNPVKELIDAGLMPTIVEDLDSSEDIYSYKSQLARKTESLTNKLNPSVRKGLAYLYIGQKTPLYKSLNRATQLSDFVARYTLYHYLQERTNDPVSRSEAITRASDAFVNYDIPTHKSLQYLNDMGLVMFTKYYLRIQRVILQLFQEKPARAMIMSLLGNFVDGAETIMDSNMLSRLGNNPFSTGALRYPTTLDDIATVNAALSLK